jgi:hypothetical protein
MPNLDERVLSILGGALSLSPPTGATILAQAEKRETTKNDTTKNAATENDDSENKSVKSKENGNMDCFFNGFLF